MEENIVLTTQAHARITLEAYQQTGIEVLAPNCACIRYID
jgi:hypothetical protein